MRRIDEYRYTGNNVVYKKARKQVLENTGEIYCSYCPYNKGENSRLKDFKCWKRYRKTQYKNKDVFSGEVR